MELATVIAELSPGTVSAVASVADIAIKVLLGIVITALVGWFTQRKLEQEDEKHRESHTLELFQALSTSNPHLQMATASVLVERLKRLKKDRKRKAIDYSEEKSIEHALHSILKRESSGPGIDAGDRTSPQLGKYVAEQIVRLLDAQPLDADGRPPDLESAGGKQIYSGLPRNGTTSPLKRFDWQKVRVVEAWWPGIDARGVDFFKAEFIDCGMRYARMSGTVFYEAVLRGSRLSGADLTGANFYNADIERTDFREANVSDADFSHAKNWDKARWQGAIYTEKTRFPAGFVPEQHEMRLAAPPRA